MKRRVQSRNSVLVAIKGGCSLHMLFYALHIILSLIFTWIICALYLSLFSISVILFSRMTSLKTMNPRNVIFLSQESRNYRQGEKKTNTKTIAYRHIWPPTYFSIACETNALVPSAEKNAQHESCELSLTHLGAKWGL